MSEGGDRVTDFEKLYNTYFNDVYLYIRRLSGDEHIAEEITSETFFKAMHSIDSFRGDCDVRVWLCQIAKNCYYTHIKKIGKIQETDLDVLQNLPDPSPGLAEQLIRKEEVQRIQKVLPSLPAANIATPPSITPSKRALLSKYSTASFNTES